MAKKIQQGDKGGLRTSVRPPSGEKRQRWTKVQHETKPVLLLPPTEAGAPVLPAWRAAADQQLVECRQRYNAGDKYAILDALYIRVHDFPEQWLRDAVMNALDAHYQYAAETLDQAFGIKRPKGKGFAAARRDALLREPILFRVYELHRQGMPLDGRLFAEVGSELGISGIKVRRIFSELRSKELREMLRRQPISECSNTAENVTRTYLKIV
jgi:hypothetical protein